MSTVNDPDHRGSDIKIVILAYLQIKFILFGIRQIEFHTDMVFSGRLRQRIFEKPEFSLLIACLTALVILMHSAFLFAYYSMKQLYALA